MRRALVLALLGLVAVWIRPAESGAGARLLQSPAASEDVFLTSHSCFACHNGLTTRSGEDVSIGFDWRSSMMANSARDPYWQASVRRETIDHPASAAAIEDECAKCHMPMARYDAQQAGEPGAVFRHLPVGERTGHRDLLAADGVSCALCHQISDEGLGTESSFVGGFVISPEGEGGERPVFGPFEIDESRIRLMRSATGFTQTEATHVQESEFCATCHTLITEALGPDGGVVGELPEQVPYQEWLHSDYVAEASCQDCHMPVVEEATSITSVLGEAREGLSRHTFRGANFFMLQILQRHREELGVEALAQELELAASQTRAQLGSESGTVSLVSVARQEGRLEVTVMVRSQVGHKLPTAYPSRRVWLELTVRDGDGDIVFRSGEFRPNGEIAGNDNDQDPERFEPHYEEIRASDQVQIYESILVNAEGRVTTGLLEAVGYGKDNRILPRGFDKAAAEPDIAVHGAAAGDPNFAGGSDQVVYSIDPGDAVGELQVEAVLWYQPVGFRWAENLRPYAAPEPERFVRYYSDMSEFSATVLARDSTTLR